MQSWCQIYLTITTVMHTDSLPRITMCLGNALLSDPGVSRPLGHVAGYRSSGSARRQATVSAIRLPSITAAMRAGAHGKAVTLRVRCQPPDSVAAAPQVWTIGSSSQPARREMRIGVPSRGFASVSPVVR
jgi:hypothetical protein